jgi:hypothetical protein
MVIFHSHVSLPEGTSINETYQTSHLVWMTFPAKTSTVLGSSQHHEELKPQQVVALGPEELRQEQRKADRQARRWATGVRNPKTCLGNDPSC